MKNYSDITENLDITTKQYVDSGFMPKKGGTFTGEVKFGSTENFQGYYIKRMIGSLGAGTAYNNLDSLYKDGTWHRMWRLRFPSGSNFWGKIKITLYGGYSSFNASGVMSKSITCNFNTSNIYNNVGCYDGLGVNVEQDFRISEAIWNATANAWEVLIWQKNLKGNNSPVIMLECWTTNNTNYINAFNGIAAQAVELTQSTSYSAQKASSTGGTKTVEWEALPVYENPLGEEIATVAMLEDKQDKITSSNKLSASLVSGLATVATSGSYDDLSHKPTIPTVNNGTLTIQKNGTTVKTFSANQSGNVTANITVPTKVSELTNDSEFTSNAGTITGIKMNGASKGTSGVVDLGTVLTAHQDISGKLDKTTYEVNKVINFGSTGVLYVGKFKVYDTNVTCEVTSTTSVTYSGKLVIATQNYVIMQMTVYGDAANTVAPNFFIKPSTTSDPYIEIYFKPASWSKNVIHIYGSAIAAEPTNVCTNVSAVPSTATSKPTNALNSKANLSDLPTVNNGTLTIQKNGTTVATFSANQKDGTTANITVPTKASDVNALSLDGGTIKKSKTIKMDASANSDGANLKWGTVNSKNPYIGYASDQTDGTFVVGSLLGTNYASGLAIGGGSGNLLWKGTKVATTSDIPDTSNLVQKSAFSLSGTTLTITI